MRNSRTTHWIGILYGVSALAGLLMAVTGLAALWITHGDVTRQVTSAVALGGRALDATDATIGVVTRALESASGNLALINQMIEDMAGSLDDTNGLIETTSGLIGGDMVLFVEQTQVSLASVETSARLVDDTLRFISGIPLIGRRYQPEKSLQESVREVSQSLEPLPESFGKIEDELNTSAANMAVMQSEVERMADEISEIDASLTEANERVEEYRLILIDVQTRYDKFEQRLPGLMNGVYAVLTLVLVWIILSQAAVLLHGLALMNEQ